MTQIPPLELQIRATVLNITAPGQDSEGVEPLDVAGTITHTVLSTTPFVVEVIPMVEGEEEPRDFVSIPLSGTSPIPWNTTLILEVQDKIVSVFVRLFHAPEGMPMVRLAAGGRFVRF